MEKGKECGLLEVEADNCSVVWLGVSRSLVDLFAVGEDAAPLISMQDMLLQMEVACEAALFSPALQQVFIPAFVPAVVGLVQILPGLVKVVPDFGRCWFLRLVVELLQPLEPSCLVLKDRLNSLLLASSAKIVSCSRRASSVSRCLKAGSIPATALGLG